MAACSSDFSWHIGACFYVSIDPCLQPTQLFPTQCLPYVYDRHEAAYKLTSNAEAVAKFACRGAGKGSGWNLLPGRAPLSDPNASPNLDILPDVDYCLRRVSLPLPYCILSSCVSKPLGCP